LFDSGTKPYTRHPELLELIPLELYERGRRLASRLVEHVSPTSLLHGDLTPSNILDGGGKRGLVAIDPAPCLGDDLAFDAVHRIPACLAIPPVRERGSSRRVPSEVLRLRASPVADRRRRPHAQRTPARR